MRNSSLQLKLTNPVENAYRLVYFNEECEWETIYEEERTFRISMFRVPDVMDKFCQATLVTGHSHREALEKYTMPIVKEFDGFEYLADCNVCIELQNGRN